jgi:hypothetical protein
LSRSLSSSSGRMPMTKSWRVPYRLDPL